MHVISRRPLAAFGEAHPDAKTSLDAWWTTAARAGWTSRNDVLASFPNAHGVGEGRIRFEIAGGRYRLIVAFDFARRVAFVKFLGSHAEYDRIDAATVSQY
jgi:mRNA interferase HigB